MSSFTLSPVPDIRFGAGCTPGIAPLAQAGAGKAAIVAARGLVMLAGRFRALASQC